MKNMVMVIIALFICSCSSTPPVGEPFSVDIRSSRLEAGSIEAYLDKLFSSRDVKKTTFTVYYYPAEDVVCLRFKVNFYTCSQFWNRAGRDAFVGAFERYQEEYEQQKLIRDNRKIMNIYGMTQGFFTWRLTTITTEAQGQPLIKLGYQFKGDGVFFTTTQMKSLYQDPLLRSRNQTSPVTKIYYSRSQAENLIALFKQEYLQSLVLQNRTGGSNNSDVDRYW